MLTGRGVLGVQSAVDEPGSGSVVATVMVVVSPVGFAVGPAHAWTKR
jgi:hypothetical protein